MLSATTLGGWAVSIALALEYFKVDPEPIFNQVGINLEEAKRPSSRFPATKMARLMSVSAQTVNDPAFGLHAGRFMRPTSWHALGFSIWASGSLRQGFNRLVRYKRIFTTCGDMWVEESEGAFQFNALGFQQYQTIIQPEEYDALLSSIALTCKHLLTNDFCLVKVEFPHPEPKDISGFQRMFKCPLVFNSNKAALHISTQLVDLPLPTANPELAQTNDKICEDYLARLDRDDVVTQVRHYLYSDLHVGEPQMEQVAHAMHLSTRSLQRKLTDRGTSFKCLLDSTRQELARQYLEQSHLTISEISYRLGFSHISNFSRAFKRWTGLGPTEFREQMVVSKTD